ncbi:LysR family transcriptional regulator [Massilia sp. H6]|uniref:LysR family transcriptional regulator n=1 Tax=Massilia sp. H6 TaxID=2970464 RepID=UPI002169A48D|nr:LysR family transcriptional regulator [Massilia sp. H6]UVW28514.1 LysR family transcriptional regulator [Massilia sp. H6]
MLNPQWLRSFDAVAEAGSFTRAAEQLGLTQAAVSQHISRLEDEFGPLLLRRPRQLDLTPAGHALLACHAEILAAERRLRARLSDDDPHHGEISLITPGSVGLALYPLLLALQQAEPGLCVRHRFAPDAEVCEAVLDNRFELGLLTLKPDDPRLVARLFAEEPLELVVPANARLDGWEDLARLGMIDHPDGQAMATRLLSRYFPGNPGVRSLAVRGYVNQIGLILEPVARGLGFAILPRHARQAFARPDAVRVVEAGAPVLDSLWLIHRAEWPLSARATAALDFLQHRI